MLADDQRKTYQNIEIKENKLTFLPYFPGFFISVLLEFEQGTYEHRQIIKKEVGFKKMDC